MEHGKEYCLLEKGRKLKYYHRKPKDSRLDDGLEIFRIRGTLEDWFHLKLYRARYSPADVNGATASESNGEPSASILNWDEGVSQTDKVG